MPLSLLVKELLAIFYFCLMVYNRALLRTCEKNAHACTFTTRAYTHTCRYTRTHTTIRKCPLLRANTRTRTQIHAYTRKRIRAPTQMHARTRASACTHALVIVSVKLSNRLNKGRKLIKKFS